MHFELYFKKETKPRMNFHVCNITKENAKGKKYKVKVIEFYESGEYTKRKRVRPNTLCKFLGEHPEIYTSKKDIERLTYMALEKGYSPFGEKSNDVDNDPILSDYLLSFWDYDNSPYIKERNLLSSDTITRSSAKKNIQLIKSHIILSDSNKFKDGQRIGYYLPEGLRATELTVNHLDKLKESIIFEKELSPKTFKNILSAINPPLEELVRKEIINSNPLDRVIKPKINNKKSSYDAFSKEEIESICNYLLDNIYSVNGREVINQTFVILTAIATGMRQAEILALQPKNIVMLEDSDFAAIYIERAYNKYDGFKSPKSEIDRWTYCDKRLAKVLLALQPDPDGLIFKGHLNTQDEILGSKGLRSRLYNALSELGIKRDDQKLVFHSFRHYANTELNVRGGSDIANTIIGHESTSAMNDRYNHPDANTMREFSSKCGSLLPESALIKIDEFYNLEFKEDKK